MMWKFIALIVLLTIGVGVGVVSDPPRPRADFTFINRGDVATLDVQRASWMQDLRVIRCLYEGLVKNDIFSREFSLLPGVAQRWEISPDARTYTFHLRADARWSNGDAVRASDFVFAWRRALMPETACDYTGLFQLIEGGKEFFDARTRQLAGFRPGVDDARALYQQAIALFDASVGVKALDERTLQVRLVRPTPYFLNLCAFAVFYPVYPPLVSSYEKPSQLTGRIEIASGWTKSDASISNGPFRLASWRFKRDLRLEKNEYFWDRASIALDSIAIPSVEDPNAAVMAFRTGAVDWVTDTVPGYRAEILAGKRAFEAEHSTEIESMRAEGLDLTEIARRLPHDPRNFIHAFPAFGTYFFNFNCLPRLADGRDNPFADPRVRRAFVMAIDKRRIVEQVRRVGEPIATTLIPRDSIPGYSSPKGLAFNPDAARKLLAEAGFPGGKGFITVEILFNTDGGHDKVAETIKKDWEENLGVSVSLQQREVKVFRNDLKNQNFMVSRAGWFGDYGDPTTFLDLNRRDDGNNDRKYNSEEFESLMNRADTETDPEARMAILRQAEELIVERDLPLIPLYQYVQMYMYDPRKVTGISSHPRQEQNAYRIDVLGDGKGLDTPRAIPPGKRGLGKSGRIGRRSARSKRPSKGRNSCLA